MKLKKTYSFGKISLQKVSLKNLEDFHSYSVDKNFFKYLEYAPFKNKRETKEYFKKKIKNNNFVDNFWWSIV